MDSRAILAIVAIVSVLAAGLGASGDSHGVLAASSSGPGGNQGFIGQFDDGSITGVVDQNGNVQPFSNGRKLKDDWNTWCGREICGIEVASGNTLAAAGAGPGGALAAAGNGRKLRWGGWGGWGGGGSAAAASSAAAAGGGGWGGGSAAAAAAAAAASGRKLQNWGHAYTCKDGVLVDGNGAVVSFGWWPFSSLSWTGRHKCFANGVWGPNGGVITGTTGNGGFAAAGASAGRRMLGWGGGGWGGRNWGGGGWGGGGSAAASSSAAAAGGADGGSAAAAAAAAAASGRNSAAAAAAAAAASGR